MFSRAWAIEGGLSCFPPSFVLLVDAKRSSHPSPSFPQLPPFCAGVRLQGRYSPLPERPNTYRRLFPLPWTAPGGRDVFPMVKTQPAFPAIMGNFKPSGKRLNDTVSPTVSPRRKFSRAPNDGRSFSPFDRIAERPLRKGSFEIFFFPPPPEKAPAPSPFLFRCAAGTGWQEQRRSLSIDASLKRR